MNAHRRYNVALLVGFVAWSAASCGSGKSIGRIVSGLAPEVDFAFTGLEARTRRTDAVEMPV